MIHGEKFFIIEENQNIWDKYLDDVMEKWNTENREKLEAQTYTEEEKIEYSKRIHGDISPKNITPYKYAHNKKRQSSQQCKPIVREFEMFVKKSFNEITDKDIEEFSRVTTKSSKLNHFTGFLSYCVTNGIIKNHNEDFLICLLPKDKRIIGKMIAEGNGNKDRSQDFIPIRSGMMRCIYCGNLRDAKADNWVLIQIGNNKEKRLACRECEGRDGKYQY